MSPVYLVDNGSLRPEAFLNLRRVARELGRLLGVNVRAASVMHSDKIPAELLEGEAAVTLEAELRALVMAGQTEVVVLPFFFGPTGALTWYLEERLDAMRADGLAMTVRVAPFLDPGPELDDGVLAKLVATRVRETLSGAFLERPPVILVDHGSPAAAVTAVRNRLAARLGVELEGEVSRVEPASMERREGPEYDFNEPMLEHKLDESLFNNGTVVVALLFLSPGRHAGLGGDIDRICAAAEARHPGLKIYQTALVGTHFGVIELLRRRWEQVQSGHGQCFTTKDQARIAQSSLDSGKV